MDENRVKVLNYIANELRIIIENIEERKFHKMIDRLYDLLVIAKMLKDSKPIIHLYQMLASLFLNVGYKREAYILFETAKDLAHEAQNLAQEMICFEYMARTK